MNTPSQLQMLVAKNVATWRRMNQAKVTPTEAELATAHKLAAQQARVERQCARWRAEREARRNQYWYGFLRTPLVSVAEALAA